jgi:integrase
VAPGIRWTRGTAQDGKVPVLTAEMRRRVDALPAGALGVRDRALLSLGFAAALRRFELVGLDVGDVEETTDGLVVRVRKSKTDEEGAGSGAPRVRRRPGRRPRPVWTEVAAWAEEAWRDLPEGDFFLRSVVVDGAV